MYEDKFNELEKLKKKQNIGTIIIIIMIIGIFAIPYLINIKPELLNKTEDPSMFITIFIIGYLILLIVVYKIFCSPYLKLKNIVTNEVKSNVLRNELNNIFNSTYLEEDSLSYEGQMNSLEFTDSISVNDCFSAKYNNIRFKYADLRLYHHSDDSTVTDFRGPIFEFDTNMQVDSPIYIGITEKFFLGKFSTLDSIINTRKYKDIKPTNNMLDEKICIKSSNNQSILDNPNFQTAVNEIMNQGRYFIIYKDNKIYVLVYNSIDSFEINVKNKEDEVKSQEKIRNEVIVLKEELDNILKYKEQLFIKNTTF